MKIALMGKTINLTKKDLKEFEKFHREHFKDAKCYYSYQNNELCLHEVIWLLFHKGVIV